MKKINAGIAILLMGVSGLASAGHYSQDAQAYEDPAQATGHEVFEYAKVTRVEPVFRQVRRTQPVRECEDRPVYHSRSRGSKSAGGMLAGGLIGGIIGHQVGKGSGRRVATAVGTLIGAQIGHDAVNGHGGHGGDEIAGYRQHCETHYRVGYEEVNDGYDVTYKYRDRHYTIHMPYDPGKRIKMRIQVTPVI